MGVPEEKNDKGQQMIQRWSKVLEDRVHESKKNRTKWIMYALFKLGKLNHKIAWFLVHSSEILHNTIFYQSPNLEKDAFVSAVFIPQAFIEYARWHVGWCEITN